MFWRVALLIVFGALTVSCARPAGSVAMGGVPPDLLAVLDIAWIAWFAGDQTTLGWLLPPEFIAINNAEQEWQDRAATLEASAQFARGGGRLVSVRFPRTEVQRIGSVYVLYSTYEATIAGGDGRQVTLTGRATEV